MATVSSHIFSQGLRNFRVVPQVGLACSPGVSSSVLGPASVDMGGMCLQEPGAFPEHIPDDYDAARQRALKFPDSHFGRKQRKKELEEHHSALPVPLQS